MTQRDYEVIADALLRSRPAYGDERIDAWETVINNITYDLTITYPNFDQERFTAAATGEER